jgi:hypothetical protein
MGYMADKKEGQIVEYVDTGKKRTRGNPVWEKRVRKIPPGPPAESIVPTMDELPPVGVEGALLSESPQRKLPNLPEEKIHLSGAKPDIIFPPGEETKPVIQKDLPGFNKKK